MQDVEEQRLQRQCAACGVLEGVRPAVLTQRDRLAVEHGAADRQGERGLDDLRHARGDVVERARVDDDVAAVAVDLGADAVELPLDRRRADLLHRGGDVGRGRGEHRPDAATDLQPDRAQGLGTARHRGRGDVAEVAVQHQRAAQDGGGHAGGLGGGLGHHALERALADAAGEQRAHELLLGAGRAPEQRGDRGAPGRLRAGAGERPDRRERGVDVDQRQRRDPHRRRRVADGRPADADLALAQLAGQERDGDRGLLRRGGAQGVGEHGDLAAARAGGADGLGCADELGEQHYGRREQMVLPSRRDSVWRSTFSFFCTASRSFWSFWK